MGLKDGIFQVWSTQESLVTFLGLKNQTSPYGNFFFETPCIWYFGDMGMRFSLNDHLWQILIYRYNIPYLIDKPGVGNNICGELYEVDDKMLAKLDELEDHPNYYQRRIETVIKNDDKKGLF